MARRANYKEIIEQDPGQRAHLLELTGYPELRIEMSVLPTIQPELRTRAPR